jgi:hypothetical protein
MISQDTGSSRTLVPWFLETPSAIAPRSPIDHVAKPKEISWRLAHPFLFDLQDNELSHNPLAPRSSMRQRNMETMEPWRLDDIENHGTIEPRRDWKPRRQGSHARLATKAPWRERWIGASSDLATLTTKAPWNQRRIDDLGALTLGRDWRRSRHGVIAGLECHRGWRLGFSRPWSATFHGTNTSRTNRRA